MIVNIPSVSRELVRPLPPEVRAIRHALIDLEGTPGGLWLAAVLGWANGRTMKELAQDPAVGLKRDTVRKAVHLYRQKGLDGFRSADVGRIGRRGSPPLPAAEVAAIEKLLRQAIAAGRPISYREVARVTKRSLGSVAAVAKRAGLDPKRRRGPVAPPPSST